MPRKTFFKKEREVLYWPCFVTFTPMKTSLPIAGIPLYDINSLNTSYYTTTNLGNYIDGDNREEVGSHCGIDVDATKYADGHTDVFAVADGEVVTAGLNHASNGNYVVLKHENSPSVGNPTVKTTYFSCYLHMSSLNVTVNESVSHGDKIGVTGDTGNTTAAHLHFQIDTVDAPFHPYWPFTTAEYQAAGYSSFTDAVNHALNMDKAKLYTIHPMTYVQLYLDASDEAAFTDIPASDPDYEAIKYLKEQNVIQGYSDGSFKPDNPINRAELMKMAFVAFGYPTRTFSSSSFSDVKTTDWFFKYVETAKQDGLIVGYGDGTFKPASNITRAETIKVILNVGAIAVSAPATKTYFSDVSVQAWYTPYINVAYEQNTVDHTSTFQPNGNVTRRYVARWLYRMVGA